jgi:Kef-type K+ transport system membrane component KefB
MELLYWLLILLVLTRAGGEAAARLGQPPLVGEILAGIGLGILISRFETSFPVLSGLKHDSVFDALSDLGIFFLMLLGGLELQPRDVVQASRNAVWVALAGFLLPLATGFATGWIFLPQSSVKIAQCLFIGTALAVTAVPVAVRMLIDVGQLSSEVGQTVISAAVVDDVLSLILLAMLVALLQTGSLPSGTELIELGGRVLLFFALTTAAGIYVAPVIGRFIMRARIAEFEFSALLIAALAFALLAEVLGLHFILGAFLAGLFFTRRVTNPETYDAVTSRVSGVTSGFLAPIFFASIGIHLDLSAATTAPLFLAVLLLVAASGKLLGAGGVAYICGLSRREALGVGAGMMGRGAVELIIADIALRAGLFAIPEPVPPIVASLFSSVVIMAVVTTVMAPILLRRVLSGLPE